MRFLDTDTKFMKIRFLKLYTSSLKRNTSKTSNFARKRNHQYSTKRVKLNGKVLNPYIVYDLLEPDFVIYSLLLFPPSTFSLNSSYQLNGGDGRNLFAKLLRDRDTYGHDFCSWSRKFHLHNRCIDFDQFEFSTSCSG